LRERGDINLGFDNPPQYPEILKMSMDLYRFCFTERGAVPSSGGFKTRFGVTGSLRLSIQRPASQENCPNADHDQRASICRNVSFPGDNISSD
jgi:hypothetical protein